MAIVRDDVSRSESKNLRNPPTRIVEKQEKQVITPLRPGLIRDSEQRIDLIASEKAEDGPGNAFLRDGENAPGRFGHLWSKEIACVMNEGANGGESGIAAANAVVAVFFEIGKKSENGLGTAGLQGQLGGRRPAGRLQKSKKQTEGIAISANGAGAEVTLRRDVFGEKPLKQTSEIWIFHGSGD